MRSLSGNRFSLQEEACFSGFCRTSWPHLAAKASVMLGGRRHYGPAVWCQKKSQVSHCRALERRSQVKGRKDNLWSVETEIAKAEARKESKRAEQRKKREMLKSVKKRTRGKTILVSGSMKLEEESAIRDMELVSNPRWDIFESAVVGAWKGVVAAFSPSTAEMDPVQLGSKNENIYECYTLSNYVPVPATLGEVTSKIVRVSYWVGVSSSNNPHQNATDEASGTFSDISSVEFETSDTMGSENIGNEPGVFFFEDGSCSKGPVDILAGEVKEETKSFITPIFEFEQCVARSSGRRLRVIQTVEFKNDATYVELLRVVVFDEQKINHTGFQNQCDDASSSFSSDLKLFSQRERTQPADLSGTWKVVEVCAAAISGERVGACGEPEYAFCNAESLRKRSFPKKSLYCNDGELTTLWLPGGVTSRVDVSEDGILSIGIGWYSDKTGLNLVLERKYGVDKKLVEVSYQSEKKVGGV